MDDPLLVRGLKRLGDLARDGEGLCDRKTRLARSLKPQS